LLVEASGLAEMERVGDKQKRAMVRLKGAGGDLEWVERSRIGRAS